MYWDIVFSNLIRAGFTMLPLLAVISTVCWGVASYKSHRLIGAAQEKAKRRARKLCWWMIIQLVLLVVFVIALFLLLGESAEPLPQ